MDIYQEHIDLLRAQLEVLQRMHGPVRKYKAGRNCQKGYNCGGSCIRRKTASGKDTECRKALEGEAKNYSDWLVQKTGGAGGAGGGDDSSLSALERGKAIGERMRREAEQAALTDPAMAEQLKQEAKWRETVERTRASEQQAIEKNKRAIEAEQAKAAAKEAEKEAARAAEFERGKAIGERMRREAEAAAAKPKAEPKQKAPAKPKAEPKPKAETKEETKKVTVGGVELEVGTGVNAPPGGVKITERPDGWYGVNVHGMEDVKMRRPDEIARHIDEIKYRTSAPPARENEIGSAVELRQGPPIKSQKDFERDFEEAKKRIQEQNPGSFTQINQVRSALGGRISRQEFDERLTDMVANDKAALESGEMPTKTPEKHQDSYRTPAGNFRYYVR